MRIIIDERESLLYDKSISIQQTSFATNTSLQILKKVIPLGDILIENEDQTPFILIERKSLQDLLASIKDGRYEEQSYRLQHSDEFPKNRIIYLVEGMLSQISRPGDKKMILSAMTSLSIFKGFSVIRTCSLQESAEWLVNMVDKIDRTIKKKGNCFILSPKVNNENKPVISESDTPQIVSIPEIIPEHLNVPEPVNVQEPAPYCSVVKKIKKENVTPENMGEIILCQIPGISSVSAVAIMKSVDGSLIKLIDILQKNPSELEKINMCTASSQKTRKISKTILQNLQKYLNR